MKRVESTSSNKFAVWAIVGALAVVAGLVTLPIDMLNADLGRFLAVSGSVIVVLLFVHRRYRESNTDPAFRMSLAIWWFLLGSEALFPRPNNGVENAAAGRFSSMAYGESGFWLFLALCFAFVAFPRFRRLTPMLQGRFAVAFAVVVVSVLSVLWAPDPLFSAAWSFKLLLGVCIVAFWAASLRTLRDLRSVLLVTFFAFMFLTAKPVIEGTVNYAHAFSGSSYAGESVVEEGRFHSSAHPLVIAGRAGILGFLALLFYSLERKRSMIVITAGCLLVIALAGAKTAFVAAAIAIGLLFSLRRRLGTAFGLLVAIGVLAFIVVSTTAVGGYIADYLQSGDLMTISGRTELWSAAWPEIVNHLAAGHGYVASKVVSLNVGIPWYAGHLHNALLETLYNNGLIGLILLLTLNVVIATDLLRLYAKASRHEIRLVASSLLALYCFVFLNGLTEPYFGGEASAFYLLFLALFGISEWLRHYSSAMAREHVLTELRSTGMVTAVYRAS